jgi:hypothetical protein
MRVKRHPGRVRDDAESKPIETMNQGNPTGESARSSLIFGVLIGGPDRDRTDDLFHTMENQQLTEQTAKEL